MSSPGGRRVVGSGARETRRHIKCVRVSAEVYNSLIVADSFGASFDDAIRPLVGLQPPPRDPFGPQRPGLRRVGIYEPTDQPTNIALTREVWNALVEIGEPGQTFDDVLRILLDLPPD